MVDGRDASPGSERAHPTLELISTITSLGGSILVALGAIAILAAPDFAAIGRSVLVAGLVLVVASPATSYLLTTLRGRMAKESGGRSYDVLRGWQRLKVAGLLLNLLGVAAAILLVLAILVRGDIVAAELQPGMLDRVVVIMAAALAGAGAYALHHSLRTPRELDRTGPNAAIAATAVTGAAACTVLAVVAQAGQGGALSAHLGRDDVALLALAALVATAYALFRTRSLPNLSILLSENKAAYDGRGGGSRNRSVLLPAILAFALLLIVFLLFLLFGIGVATILDEVGRSPFLLGLLLFLVAAILVTLVLSFSLTRSSDAPNALYTVLVTKARRRRVLIIAASATASIIFLIPATLAFVGAFGVPKAAAMHFLCLAILSAVGPYGFYMSREHNRIRRLEDRFPDFLRDIASSHKGGLTLHQAVTIAARGEYGPLTPEVRKMADQLSWNVSFSESLVQFADRVDTPLVERAVNLILEADRSGGSTTDILLAASRDARELKNLENDRRLTMTLYTVVIYITFFVFLAVAAVLYAQFVPQLVASSEAANADSPLAGGFAGAGGTQLTLADYQLFYFLAAVVQGLGDGIVAGLMGTGKAVLGLRHSFIMVAISYIVFALFLV